MSATFGERFDVDQLEPPTFAEDAEARTGTRTRAAAMGDTLSGPAVALVYDAERPMRWPRSRP